MLDLSGHDRVSDLLAFEEPDQPAQLTHAHPFTRRGLLFNLLRCLFLYCRDHHLDAPRSRAVEHEKWKSSVACNQSVFHEQWGVGSRQWAARKGRSKVDPGARAGLLCLAIQKIRRGQILDREAKRFE